MVDVDMEELYNINSKIHKVTYSEYDKKMLIYDVDKNKSINKE